MKINEDNPKIQKYIGKYKTLREQQTQNKTKQEANKRKAKRSKIAFEFLKSFLIPVGCVILGWLLAKFFG